MSIFRVVNRALICLICSMLVIMVPLLFAGDDVLKIEIVKSPVEKNLLSVAFAGEKLGFAVGDDGTIIKTTDGGVSWERVKVDSDADFRSISFSDEKTGWVVGTNGTSERLPQKVLDFLSKRCRADLETLMFLSGGHFLSSSDPPPHPTVMVTTDGGKTWSKKKVLKTNFPPTAVCAIDKDTAWLSTYSKGHGDGDIWMTDDGGERWKLYRIWRNIYDLQMLDKESGIAVGEPETYLGKREKPTSILRIFAEKMYEPIYTDFSSKEAVMALHFISKDEGWVVTEQGAIYHTSDGCENFTRQFGPPPPKLNRRPKGYVYSKKIKFPYEVIRFRNKERGLVGGRKGLLYTVDGGKKWKETKLPQKVHIHGIAFLTPSLAVAVADKGLILRIKFD